MSPRRTNPLFKKPKPPPSPRAGAGRRAPSGGGHGQLWALLILGFLVLAAIGAFAFGMYRELDAGLMAQRDSAVRRADWVPLRSVPAFVPGAFVAVVDTSVFYRAPERLRADRPRLTDDLVRQVHRLQGVPGDARAFAMTPVLEAQTTARARLELYLNRVALGRADGFPVFGVHHAAQEFFGKEAAALTPGEAATLAGLLLPPRIVDPERTPGAVGARRNEVLALMRAGGTLDEATYRAALAEPLGFQPGIEHEPMSRPSGWANERPVIRLPDALQPSADSTPPAASRP